MKEPWQEEMDYRDRYDDLKKIYHCCDDCGEPLVDGGYNLDVKGNEIWICEDCMKDLYFTFNTEV